MLKAASADPMNIQNKWQANKDKVAFAKAFPGMLPAWRAAAGKAVAQVVAVEGGDLVIFTDGTFLPAFPMEPAALIAALLKARPWLEPHDPAAYAELDEKIATDRELTRQARLSNIMGAIQNNIGQIPEIEGALEQFLLARQGSRRGEGSPE